MNEELGWLNEQEFGELINRFEKMIKNDHQYFFDVDEFEIIIDYYLDTQNFQFGRKAIEEGLRQHPGTSEFDIRRARLLAYEKKYYEALELLNHIELLEPTNDQVYTAKGEIYSMMNKHELAIKEYKKSISYSETPEDIYASIAYEYENMNDYPQAIKNLKKALKIKPDSENLIHEIAFFFELTGRDDEAIQFFTEFLDKNPYSKVGWFNLGIFYNTLELYEKAIEAYEFTLAIDEEFSSAYFNIANSYSGLQHYKKAIKYYEKTFEFEAPEPLTYYYIGESYENMDDLESALKNFNKAIKLDDKIGEPWAGSARIAVKQQQDLKAIKCYERAILLMPLNDDYKYELAVVKLRNRMFSDAETLFKEIVEHDSTFIEAWINYSVCMNLSASIETAIDIIEKAIEKNKDEASLWYRLAGLLYKSGKVQQAYYYIETALKLDFETHAELLEFIPELEKESRFIELLGV
ncbi:MAG TPA: tetratricopeptide repeat protein, partial [Bacteroidales bacterium]